MDIPEYTLYDKRFDTYMQALLQYKEGFHARFKELQQDYKNVIRLVENYICNLDMALDKADLSSDDYTQYSYERDRLDMFIREFLEEE